MLVPTPIGCYLPNILLAWRIRTRTREIFESFPDAADLMLVGVEAGLAKIADEIKLKSRALAEELHLTNLDIRAASHSTNRMPLAKDKRRDRRVIVLAIPCCADEYLLLQIF